MRSVLLTTVAAITLASCAVTAPEPAAAPAAVDVAVADTTPELGAWGVDLNQFDMEVNPGDDFFSFVNGAWLDSFEIPADRSSYSSFTVLAERSEKRVRSIIEDAAAADAEAGTIEQKIGDLFNSWMNADAIEAKGLAPIEEDLAAIAAAASSDDLALFVNTPGVSAIDVWGGGVSVDAKDPEAYTYYMSQGGLGLPDRNFYLQDTDRFTSLRAGYLDVITTMFTLLGEDADEARAKAEAILAFETKIAEVHWERTKSRNRDLTYNPMTLTELEAYAPGYPWSQALAQTGATDLERVVLSQKDAFPGLAKIWAEADLDTLKDYVTFHYVNRHAAFLPEAFDQASFEFFGKQLGGSQQQRERWKRGVSIVNGNMGFAVGEVYVARHFPPEAKAEMQTLVDNLREAFAIRLESLEWMGEDTRAQAMEKLTKFTPKIGYPDKWRDYSALEIDPDDLMGNIRRSRKFSLDYNLSKLGQPIDKTEWFMTPQTVNAYYSPTRNEIVFPAAILQAPFFDLNADPAVNYGGIGGVIGHEIGHGFDDQGSKSDGDGRLRNWWTDDDRAAFEERTGRLVDQYSSFEPLPGQFVNGALTLGENIGDLGGLSMAFEAYKISLDGQPAPIMDGFTGEQRFFLAWAQVWRGKYREENLMNRLATGVHSPAQYRVNGVVRNMDTWYEAFEVAETDGMFVEPGQRVSIW